MLNTSAHYYKENNLFDIRIQSYIGLYEGDLARIRKIGGVKSAVGQKFADGFVRVLDNEGNYVGLMDIYGSKMTVRVYGLDAALASSFTLSGANDDSYINRLTLIEGEYPKKAGECVVACSNLATPKSFKIGEKIKIEGDNENILHSLKVDELTITGIVKTPYFLSFERGASTAGSGKLGDYIYVSDDSFTENVNYYSEAYITLKNSQKYEPYSDEYNDYVDSVVRKIQEESGEIIRQRKLILQADLQPKVDSGSVQLEQAQLEFDTQTGEARVQLEELKNLVANGQQMIDAAMAQLEAEYAKALEQISGGSAQYDDAVSQYDAAAAQVADGKVQWQAANGEYEENLAKYGEAEEELKKASDSITLAQTEIAATEAIIASTKATLNNLKSGQSGGSGNINIREVAKRLQKTNPELALILLATSSYISSGTLDDAIAEIELLLDLRAAELAAAKINLANAQQTYSEKEEELAQANLQLGAAKAELDAKAKELAQAQEQLDETAKRIQEGGIQLQLGGMEARTQYMTAKAEIALKQAQYAQAKETLPEAQKKFDEKEAEARSKLELARTMVEKGKKLLAGLDDAAWLINTRRDMPGYSSYGAAAYSMQTIALVFSTFFFIVSTIVSLTTMTRMVQEERGQLGCLKALGYTDRQILYKYLIYSAIACVIGSVIGIVLGLFQLPRVFVVGWTITYEMPKLQTAVQPLLVILGFVITVFLTLAAVVFACYKELKESASVLMRPKPPRTGKHIFLERIDFVWRRFSFTSKATARNLLRSKKRFIMSVIGIAGCTALLVSGVGFVGSARAVIANQFDEGGIAVFDLQIALKDVQTSSRESEIVSKINNLKGIESTMLSHIQVYRGSSELWDKDYEVNVYVPEFSYKLGSYVRLIDEKTGETLTLDDTGAIITDSFARAARAKVGDTVTVSRTEGSKVATYKVKVAGIVENYTFHYVYMTENYYKRVFNAEPGYNCLIGLIDDSVQTDEEYLDLETAINSFGEVTGSIFTRAILINFSQIINSLYIIISVVVMAAAILSFIVLYILNNTNIKERIRELATLKVLGLYDKDVSAYVYRENIIFTLLAIPVGFVMGMVLHKIMITTIVIEAVTLGKHISLLSYIFSAVMMMLFALVVNIVMHKYLKSVSMVESLKSVE